MESWKFMHYHINSLHLSARVLVFKRQGKAELLWKVVKISIPHPQAYRKQQKQNHVPHAGLKFPQTCLGQQPGEKPSYSVKSDSSLPLEKQLQKLSPKPQPQAEQVGSEWLTRSHGIDYRWQVFLLPQFKPLQSDCCNTDTQLASEL